MYGYSSKLNFSFALELLLFLSQIPTSTSQNTSHINNTIQSSTPTPASTDDPLRSGFDLAAYTISMMYILLSISVCIIIIRQPQAVRDRWSQTFFGASEPEDIDVEVPPELAALPNNNQARWACIDERVEQFKEELRVLKSNSDLNQDILPQIKGMEEWLKELELPQEFIDPISLSALNEPAVTDDTHSYDIDTLTRMREAGKKTPLNRNKKITTIIPNFNLSLGIHNFLDKSERLITRLETELKDLTPSELTIEPITLS